MTIGSVKLEAELFDTPTADAIYAKLPFNFHGFHLGR